jgi:hypothetical protein
VWFFRELDGKMPRGNPALAILNEKLVYNLSSTVQGLSCVNGGSHVEEKLSTEIASKILSSGHENQRLPVAMKHLQTLRAMSLSLDIHHSFAYNQGAATTQFTSRLQSR